MNLNSADMNLMDAQTQSLTCHDFLKTSIPYFLRKYPQSISWLFNSVTSHSKLIEELNKMPLEMVWFYGAVVFHRDVVFHSDRPSSLPPPGKLLAAKNVLKLVNDCTHLCSVLRKVAVIAPVVYHLHHLEVNFSAWDPSLREEIKIVVEGIVSYISICCSQYLDEGDLGSKSLGDCILDLIKIWMVRVSDENNILSSFFPGLRNEFQPEVTLCLGYLAGAVMNETILLRLCLKISPRIDRENLQRDMVNVAIQTIKGFQNFYFLEQRGCNSSA